MKRLRHAIAQCASLAVHPSLPARTVKDLTALAKARPGSLNVGSQGNGSSQHLATELFSIMAGGLKMVHVPYKGSTPAITALMTGEISVLMPTLALSLRKSLTAAGMTPAHSSPEQFGSFIAAEIARWSKVAAAASIRAD